MPWLCDADGDPISIPAACAGFRVRFWPPGARGIGELVRDRETGAPLLLSSAATPAEFRDQVDDRPGRYVLTLVDDAHRPLRRVPEGVIILHGDRARVEIAPDAIGAAALAQILERLDALDRRTSEAIAALTARVGQLGAELGALARRPVAPPPPAPRPTAPASTTPLVAPVRTPPAPPTAPLARPTTRAGRAAASIVAARARAQADVATVARNAERMNELLDALVPTPAAPSPAAVPDDRGRVEMLAGIERLPPLPRAIFGAIVRQPGNQGAAIRMLFTALAGEELVAALTETELIEPIQQTIAVATAVPLDQVRTLWLETDLTAFPPALLAFLSSAPA